MGKGLPRSIARRLSSRQVAAIAALTGTVGTANDALQEVTAVATSGGNTYADSAINAKLTIINNNFADIQAKLNALIDALKA